MSDLLKAALILGVSIVVAVLIWTYFSPYQSCVRAGGRVIVCASATSGRR